jgi:hypothetical protein
VNIAEFLLAHNARMDIFAATMLGKIEIVKAAVIAFPNIVHVPGPHKIPLLAHAEHVAALDAANVFAVGAHLFSVPRRRYPFTITFPLAS